MTDSSYPSAVLIGMDRKRRMPSACRALLEEGSEDSGTTRDGGAIRCTSVCPRLSCLTDGRFIIDDDQTPVYLRRSSATVVGVFLPHGWVALANSVHEGSGGVAARIRLGRLCFSVDCAHTGGILSDFHRKRLPYTTALC